MGNGFWWFQIGMARCLFVMAILINVSNASAAYDVLVSSTADKASPSDLNGQTVRGNIYVFVSPDTGIKGVRFFLDDPSMSGAPISEDWIAPFDFMGGMPANPYDSSRLSNGNHTITARISKKSGYGTLVEVVNASFTVNNVAIPTPLLSDDFSDGDAVGWTVVNEAGTDSPADWQVVNGEYQQINNVGFLGAGAYHLGTYSYLNASLGMSDFRFQVRAVPRSQLGRDIGVMFRYVDANNYYRVYWSASDGGARVEKKVNGIVTTLAQNTRGFKLDVPLNITVEAKGPLVQIGIDDDDKLFGFYDTSLPSGGVALYCRHACGFDDVGLYENSADTSVVIAKPEAYSVSPAASMEVSAIVLNKPAGDVRVRFEVAGVTCGDPVVEAPGEPGKFIGQCQEPSGAGHINELTATLEVNNLPTLISDTNLNVGTQGNNYLSLGDSITFGWLDEFWGDNDSKDNLGNPDGWVVSSAGYEAPLVGALNQANPAPSIVFNNGYPGETTVSALSTSRIDQALARNGSANKVLLLLGTNDANLGRSSGKGCVSNCDGTFKGSMQTILGKIRAAGKTPIVARVPPAFGRKGVVYADPNTTNQNYLIKNYNKVITSELGLAPSEIGPDFYGAFLSSSVNRYSLFSDFLHPNALGYRVMARLWYNQITGSTGLPFILSSICVRPDGVSCDNPLLYKQNLIEPGGRYYVDEGYTISRSVPLPAEVDGGVWIMPENSDKAVTAANYLTFSFSGSATIYVAYHEDISISKPRWLTDVFENTGLFLHTTNPAAPILRIYRKNFTGSATLGGNLADGASGTPQNYVVIVKPN